MPNRVHAEMMVLVIAAFVATVATRNCTGSPERLVPAIVTAPAQPSSAPVSAP